MTLTLRHGDTATMTVSNLKDKNGNPATLAASDVLHFTAKLRHADVDAAALIDKKSPANGISFTPGTGTATITVLPADWDADTLFPVDQAFVWDLQIELGGDPTQVVTAVSGDGLIKADVTRTVP